MTRATSGCRTTTSRSPATSGTAPTAGARRTRTWPTSATTRSNYGYDKLGVTDRIGYPDGSPIWAANRFTARSIRSIVAVGFYTLSSGTPYEVWAGRSLTTLTRRASGTATLPGYVTVKLDTPLPVVKGDRFVVAIRLVSPDGSLPLAIERFRRMDGPLVLAPATADGGQSYVGSKRWRMKDLTSTIPKANVCLKAFAR